MSAPRVIAELVITGIKVLGKATAAAGSQAVRNFKHKPEGAPSAAPIGSGGKNQITSQLNMSLEEAHLILNVKKDDPLDVIQKSYDRIFAANGPPAPPTIANAAAEASKSARGGVAGSREARREAAAAASGKKSRAPTHSHYLHSKVYRALERIKAEKGEAEAVKEGVEGAAAAAEAEGAAKEGAATENPQAQAQTQTQTQSPPPPPPEPKEAKTHKGGTIEL